MGRKSQRSGSVGEDIAKMALRTMGVCMVEQIATPIVTTQRRNGWVKIRRKEKVSGDIRGLLPGGRRVLAEVKTVNDDRLIFSRLKPHQVDALNENHELGAVSLLVLVHPYGHCVMRWPIEGFGPRTSIHIDDAAQYEWDGVS